MEIVGTLRAAIRMTWSLRKLINYWYLATLILVLLVALPVRSFLTDKVGDSLSIAWMELGLDYTFINDFRVNYGSAWLPNGTNTIIVAGIYWLLAIFITGGLLGYLTRSSGIQVKAATLVDYGSTYFSRLLGISIVFILLHATLLALTIFAYYITAKGFSTDLQQTESLIFGTIRWFGAGYLLLALILGLWQDFSKVALTINTEQRVTKALWQGARNAFGSFLKHYAVYFLFGVLTLVLFLGYFKIKKAVPTQYTLGLFAFVILSQVWLWIRLWIKVALLASVWSLTEKTANAD